MALRDILKGLRRGRPPHAPPRDTLAWPNLNRQGTATQANRVVYKPIAKNLRYFSRTPIARRAINSIKNPLAQTGWEIRPRKGIDMNSELERQIEIVTNCFNTPNDDDSFVSFSQQLIEDILCGAGAVELGISGDETRPLWMWPVDGLSINIFPGWSGGKNEARYVQTIGLGSYSVAAGNGIMLRNDELMYIRPNPNTATPFGFGPLEIAFNSIANQLATAQFAGKMASNALPPFMLDLGEVTNDVVKTWRSYWTNQVEGQGEIPIIGTELIGGSTGAAKARGPAVLKLYPEGDAALYLAYQEWIRTEIAAAFDISNMNLNLERDVNRNTAEVMEDRDWTHAILPRASMIASHLTREAIWAKLGFWPLEFAWVGLDREDESATSAIMKTYYEINAYTPNMILEKLGEPPAEHAWGDMTAADVAIATQAARGAALIDDPDLASDGKSATPSTPKPALKPAEKDSK